MSEETDKRHKNPDGRSTIYLGSDGYWHGRVTMGLKDDGSPDRPHVKRKRKEDVVARVKELETERDSGKVRPVGEKKWTVETWLLHWLTIVQPNLRFGAYRAYESAARIHLIPGIGKHKLDKLQPEHLERLYTRMQDAGARPGTAHQVHRTIRTALGVAEARGHIKSNPATKAKSPRSDIEQEEEIEPYTVKEIQAILREADKGRNSARWAIALALGLRQGEALGLKWSDVDLDGGILQVRRSRNKPHYVHGCGDKPCGRKIPGHCPERVSTRPDAAPTKSRAGRRTIGLPDELVGILHTHQKQQAGEKEAARQLWTDEGWLFASRTGKPLNARTDHQEWKDLLKAAGIRKGRLHDARHTAATVMLLLGIPERAVMDAMGWATTAMAKRYQHITAPVRRDIANRVGGLLWATPVEKPPAKGDDEDGDGAAGALVPA
ncbi:site-specific integrase [Kribbella sancticallisti]|uniref:Site-specific integrase n=1 Tax=Kribbella sancticallisti TaxID=460087 RepID=A0ABN2CZ82_9ACTN